MHFLSALDNRMRGRVPVARPFLWSAIGAEGLMLALVGAVVVKRLLQGRPILSPGFFSFPVQATAVAVALASLGLSLDWVWRHREQRWHAAALGAVLGFFAGAARAGHLAVDGKIQTSEWPAAIGIVGALSLLLAVLFQLGDWMARRLRWPPYDS